MPRPQKRQSHQKPHEFTSIPEFDRAMRKLAEIPKEAVERREKAERTPQKGKK